MKQKGSSDLDPEFDSILASIPELLLIELCCRHADAECAAEALRRAYDDALFLWLRIKGRILPEDFPSALKAFVSLIDRGLERREAAEKFANLPMLLRSCRAFEVRNEANGGSEGFLGALDQAPESDVQECFSKRNEYFFDIAASFTKHGRMVEVTKIQVVRRPSSRGSKKLKSLEEVKTTEARIPFFPALRALLPGSSRKKNIEIEARFVRWNAADSRCGNHGLEDYPTEHGDVEKIVEVLADNNASERLKEWKNYGFNKSDLLNVAHRIFLWTKVDVSEGRRRPQKASSTTDNSTPQEKKRERKSGHGRVRNKKWDPRFGARPPGTRTQKLRKNAKVKRRKRSQKKI